MFTKHPLLYRILLCLYLLLPATVAVAAISWLAAIPSDSQSIVLFGMSKSRLFIAGMLASAAAVFFFLSALAINRPEQIIHWLKGKLESQRFLIIVILSNGLLFIASFVFLAIPDKYLGEFWAIEERLRPLAIWLLLVSLQTLIGLIGWQVSKKPESIETLKKMLLPTGITLGVFLFVWVFIDVTRVGITKDNNFWSKSGVPLLWPQIILSLIIAFAIQFLIIRFAKDSRQKTWFDLGICILIWLVAVILWNNQSYVQGVFNTPPHPPTNEIYPINDSFTFDLAAQKMLIGQKMTIDALDKPIFIAFLAIGHWFTGNSFSNFYLFQIFIYALVPMLGYFLGKNLHSRALGAMFAVLLVIKEKNAIALTNYIHVSTSKMILSETLTTLGVLLFTILLVKWLKNPNQTNPNLWLAGGVLGLTSLVRLNTVSILPAAVFIIGLALKFNWKRWVVASILISAFVVIAAIPWVVRNSITLNSPFAFISKKTTGVIVNQRYNPLIGQNAPPENNSSNPPASTSKINKYLTIGQSMAANYFHTIVGVTVMLPPSFELYKLLDEVRLPYWKTDWDGTLLPGAFWIILGVLTLVAVGIASAWKRWRVAGLVPLAVILGYNITTAISLTSGGRYLVPIDWCVLLYFSIGLFDVAKWLLTLFGLRWENEIVSLQPTEQTNKGVPYMLVGGLMFLFLGAFPIFMETLPTQRYPSQVTISDFIAANHSIPELSTQTTADNIASLSKDPLAKIYYGRALYPRYYGEGKGESEFFDALPLIGITNYDHLSFYLISTANEAIVILPTSEKISPTIAGADTWVLGCQHENYFEAALVVFHTGDTAKIYQQESFKTSCQP